MGPRLVSRGKGVVPIGPLADGEASMGPRLVSRGKIFSGGARVAFVMLQWGRGWLAAERTHFGPASTSR